MKRFSFLNPLQFSIYAIAFCLIAFSYACHQNTLSNLEPEVAPATNDAVTYYLNLIKERQSENKSVFFYDEATSLWVENPSEPWLTAHYTTTKPVGTAANRLEYNYWGSQFSPKIGTSFSAVKINIGTLIEINYPEGCYTGGNIYVTTYSYGPTHNSCPEVTSIVTASGECNTGGACSVTVHRNTAYDCHCTSLSRKINVPSNTSVLTTMSSAYCCNVEYCW